MNIKPSALLPLLPLLFAAAPLAPSAVRPGTPFGDHAVLQSGMKVPVWGNADPGESVTVSFSGQRKETQADTRGRWRVELDPMPAGKSGDLRIGDKAFSDVVTGEVWFVGGQSNAALSLKRAVTDADAEIAQANHPQIRVWTSKVIVSKTPRSLGGGSWSVCTPENAGNFTGMGYIFARELSAARGNVPVGIISCNRGGAPIFSMISPAAFEKNPFAAEVEAHFAPLAARSPKNAFMSKGALWNGMIRPLTAHAAYAMRGVLWNQGEADVRVCHAYESLFASLVQCWRAQWKRDDLPFYVVQLANISDKGSHEPAGSDKWPLMREAQEGARRIPNVWVSVGIDIGCLDETPNTARHPANKRELGRRLALLARAHTYGESDLPGGLADSPFFQKAVVKAGRVVCHFDASAKGLKTRDGGAPGGFEIAGADGKFTPAVAVIEGETIALASPSVKAPRAARYAWNNTCEGANVINAAGLPLAPFRTVSR
ncbi:MAG: sialate O-acetylesterase [Opitutaceae bacterium]|nr:sialate O-acetylesterase [Opitutaceae bacterium]